MPTLVGGRYRPERLLGRGGLADVWLAVDERLERRVAVKLFRALGSDDRQRFREEVVLLSALGHPHLVRLFDAGTDGGPDGEQPWCAMQLVEGGTLGDRLLARPALVVAVAQVAEALAYVHRRGIVHRDVKPSNVLLAATGEAYLADFGLARMLEASRLTSTGIVVGTAAYLSPEQARGGSVGPPTDVYALGLVLLEGITGTREFPGQAVEAAAERLRRSPRIPDGLEPGLAALLRAMTADAPDERPSAEEVGRTLRRLAARPAADTAPLPVVPGPRGSEAGPALRLLPLGLAAGLVAGAVITAGLLLLGPGAEDPAAGTPPPHPTTVPAVVEPVASSPRPTPSPSHRRHREEAKPAPPDGKAAPGPAKAPPGQARKAGPKQP